MITNFMSQKLRQIINKNVERLLVQGHINRLSIQEKPIKTTKKMAVT